MGPASESYGVAGEGSRTLRRSEIQPTAATATEHRSPINGYKPAVEGGAPSPPRIGRNARILANTDPL